MILLPQSQSFCCTSYLARPDPNAQLKASIGPKLLYNKLLLRGAPGGKVFHKALLLKDTSAVLMS